MNGCAKCDAMLDDYNHAIARGDREAALEALHTYDAHTLKWHPRGWPHP